MDGVEVTEESEVLLGGAGDSDIGRTGFHSEVGDECIHILAVPFLEVGLDIESDLGTGDKRGHIHILTAEIGDIVDANVTDITGSGDVTKSGDPGSDRILHIGLNTDTFGDFLHEIVHHGLEGIHVDFIEVFGHDLDLDRILRDERFKVRILVEVHRGNDSLLVGVLFESDIFLVYRENA